jgi:hypothetical protein
VTIQRSLLAVAAAVVAATTGVGVAQADSDFRCGSRIVSVGMSQSDVLDACGEPATKDVEDVDVRSGNRVVGRTAVWRWTYVMNGVTRVLVFDQQTLKSIE